ncbi:hypothetical protein ABFX02_05G041900 [Erythranthe guttata]
MEALGLLRIRVRRGINLGVRDTKSSDTYVVVECGSQKVKTKVMENNCNPIWNEELTIYINDLKVPIILCVYDEDTFTKDDKMGDAEIDIKPYVHCLKKKGYEGVSDGTRVEKVEPSSDNCLARESFIVCNKGKLIQEMTLRLKNVECGEVEVEIEWLNLPGGSGLHD